MGLSPGACGRTAARFPLSLDCLRQPLRGPPRRGLARASASPPAPWWVAAHGDVVVPEREHRASAWRWRMERSSRPIVQPCATLVTCWTRRFEPSRLAARCERGPCRRTGAPDLLRRKSSSSLSLPPSEAQLGRQDLVSRSPSSRRSSARRSTDPSSRSGAPSRARRSLSARWAAPCSVTLSGSGRSMMEAREVSS